MKEEKDKKKKKRKERKKESKKYSDREWDIYIYYLSFTAGNSTIVELYHLLRR